MKVLFYLGHPAHYYMFRNLITKLEANSFKTIIVIRSKDTLEEILKEENIEYVKLGTKTSSKSKMTILLNGLSDIFLQDIKLFKLCRKFKPTLMIGTNYNIAHVGSFMNIKSIVLNEDDIEINKLFCKLAYPFASHIISPRVCDVGKYEPKKIAYEGYQKLAYLHPNYFTANPKVVEKYFPSSHKYAIIRLVNFNAGHDIESKNSGITNELLSRLITTIENKGIKVYITNEGILSEQYKKHVLKIKLTDIHHLMFYSQIFIADSQSMIVEAALMGVPSIRYNSFVGKISVLNELENDFKLTNGIDIKHPGKLITITEKILDDINYRTFLKGQREKMLSRKIDLTAFLYWLISNYPTSFQTVKIDPVYSSKFIQHAAPAI